MVRHRGAHHWPEVPVIECAEGDIAAPVLDEFHLGAMGMIQAPLWKAELLKTPQQGVTLLFCIHHALFDGWSLNLFMEELQERYLALQGGKVVQPKKLTWVDYCAWTKGLTQSQLYQDAIQYWQRKLTGGEARVELPVEFAHKRADSNQDIAIEISPDQVARLKKTADEWGVTLAPVLFAIFDIWLWRLSNQEELIVGYPYAGRDIPNTDNIYGAFVVVGFLRQKIVAEQAFRDLVKAVHRQMIDDKDHMIAAPYDAEVPGMDALNVIFSLQSGMSLKVKWGTVIFARSNIRPKLPRATSPLFFMNPPKGIAGRIEYDASHFRPGTAQSFARHFLALVGIGLAAAHRQGDGFGLPIPP